MAQQGICSSMAIILKKIFSLHCLAVMKSLLGIPISKKLINLEQNLSPRKIAPSRPKPEQKLFTTMLLRL